jgi:glycosyltransferase involved in cell wall biosynthesis
MNLGIVVPCYNEEEVLPETARRLDALLERLVRAGKVDPASRVCFVDDGSRDRTWAIIEELSRTNPRFSGIKLARNRGHQNALLSGLLTVPGDALVSIDADLQDDTEVIARMVDLHAQGNDIVYGVRASRATDTTFKRGTAQLYYRILHLFGVKIVYNHADFRLMSRRAIEGLRQFDEVNLFLRGIIPLIGYRTATVEYDRAARHAGESKYPLRKMLALAADGITSFSAAPLRFIAALGVLVFLVSIALTFWALWVRLFTDDAIPGWASSVIPVFFLGGVQLLSLGVLGEYMAKIYFEVKRRPRFIIEKFVGAGATEPATVAKEPAGARR